MGVSFEPDRPSASRVLGLLGASILGHDASRAGQNVPRRRGNAHAIKSLRTGCHCAHQRARQRLQINQKPTVIISLRASPHADTRGQSLAEAVLLPLSVMLSRVLAGAVIGVVLLLPQAAASWSFTGTKQVFAFNFGAAATLVTEPATLSLLGVGLLGVAWAVRRRRRKAAGD
jgi:hypothetical protein